MGGVKSLGPWGNGSQADGRLVAEAGGEGVGARRMDRRREAARR
jgi:hypothetical protein